MRARAGDLPIEIGDMAPDTLARLLDARDALVRDWGQSEAEAPAGADALLARLGDAQVAFPLEALAGVVSPISAIPVPGAAPALAGLFSHRGHVLSLIHADAALGLPPAPQAARRVAMLLRGQARGVALAVDEVLGVVRAVPQDDGSGYARVEGMGAVLLADVGAVLTTLGLTGPAQGRNDGP